MQLVIRDVNQGPFLTQVLRFGRENERLTEQQLAAIKGKAVLMISSEMEELIGVCDRIYVMAKGRISGELARQDFSQENIMKLALRG